MLVGFDRWAVRVVGMVVGKGALRDVLLLVLFGGGLRMRRLLRGHFGG